MRFRGRNLVFAALLAIGGTAGMPAFAADSVTLYTSVPTSIITKVAKAFEKHVPGVDLKVFRSGTGKLTAKIATEREAGGIKATSFGSLTSRTTKRSRPSTCS